MKFFLFLLLPLLLLAGCEKSIENFTSTPVPTTDTVWVTSNAASLELTQLQQSLARANVVDTFLVQTGATLQTTNGLRVEIPAAAFGTGLTGTARAEVNLVRTKGDLIRQNKPSLSNGMVLKTAGSFYISITNNGQPLSLQNGKMFRIALSDSAFASTPRAYVGEAPAATGLGVFNWRQSDSFSIATSASGYQLSSNRQQWMSLASGLDTVSQKSRVVLSMSAVYTNSNTQAFLVFKDAASVVQLAPDAGNRIWLAEKIPAGKSVVYVTITKKGSDYWLGSYETVTAFNQNVHITPQKKTLQAISEFLDNL